MTITPTTSDDELLRRMRAGDAQAFAALYRRHQGPVYRFALLRCGSAGTAADTVQEAFMGLLTGRLAFDPLRGSLPNFLFGVARHHRLPTRRLDVRAHDAAPAIVRVRSAARFGRYTVSGIRLSVESCTIAPSPKNC